MPWFIRAALSHDRYASAVATRAPDPGIHGREPGAFGRRLMPNPWRSG